MKIPPTLTRDQQEALAEYMVGTPVNASLMYRRDLNHHRWGYHGPSKKHLTCPACIYVQQHADAVAVSRL